MDTLDLFFKKYSYKFPKGYPDMNDKQDRILLESLLNKLGVAIDIVEANLQGSATGYPGSLGAFEKYVQNNPKHNPDSPDDMMYQADKDAKAGTVVPIAFPLIAGSGTLTSIMSLKATFDKQDKNEYIILLAILLNLIIIYLVLISLNKIEKLLGKGGLIAVRKFFGVILLAIAVKIFGANIVSFGK